MRHSTRGAAAVLASTALTAGLLTGCAADGGGSETTELRILANITPVLTKEYYEELVQPWLDEHENVTITIEVPSAENVQATLQQELASGDVPDVVASNLDPVVAPSCSPSPKKTGCSTPRSPSRTASTARSGRSPRAPRSSRSSSTTRTPTPPRASTSCRPASTTSPPTCRS
nr:hypothetical protein [Homoserinibacter gongjuensis]